MRNKFKLKKKLASIALALVLAAQPLASLQMNVFAGTGKNGVIMAPTVETNFDIDNIIELKAGETFNVNDHVTNIQPEGATVSYNVESQTVFDSGEGATEVLDVSGTVQKPGIAKVKVAVGGVSKETYIIADIKGMLNDAYEAVNATDEARVAADTAQYAANIAYYAAQSGEFFDAYVGYCASHSGYSAAEAAAAEAAAAAAYDAYNNTRPLVLVAACDQENNTSNSAPFPGQAPAWVANAATANAWATSYNNYVGGIIDKLKEAHAQDKTPVQKKWLVAAYGMAKVAAHIVAQRLSGKGLDLEAKLKVAYACYRVAEAVWIQLGNNQANLDACQAKAEALQKVIDRLYSDKVGDIAEQAAKA